MAFVLIMKINKGFTPLKNPLEIDSNLRKDKGTLHAYVPCCDLYGFRLDWLRSC